MGADSLALLRNQKYVFSSFRLNLQGSDNMVTFVQFDAYDT